MLIIRKGQTNNLIATVSMNKTLPNPYYLFSFQNITSKERISFIPEVITTNTRYDKFRFVEGPTDLTQTPPVAFFKDLSQYYYSIYEQVSSGNTNPALAYNKLESGRAVVIVGNSQTDECLFEPYISPNEDGYSIIYLSEQEEFCLSGETPTPTSTNVLTPTPTSTQTGTPTPTPTNTGTPTSTPTNTGTPTSTPTNTGTPTPTPTNTGTPTSTSTSTPTPTPTSTPLPLLITTTVFEGAEYPLTGQNFNMIYNGTSYPMSVVSGVGIPPDTIVSACISVPYPESGNTYTFEMDYATNWFPYSTQEPRIKSQFICGSYIGVVANEHRWNATMLSYSGNSVLYDTQSTFIYVPLTANTEFNCLGEVRFGGSPGGVVGLNTYYGVSGGTFNITSGATKNEACFSGYSGVIYYQNIGNQCGGCEPALTCWACLNTGQQLFQDPYLSEVVPDGYYTNEMAPGNFATWYVVGGYPQGGGFSGGCP